MMRRDPALISTVTAIPVPDRPFFANLHLLLIKDTCVAYTNSWWDGSLESFSASKPWSVLPSVDGLPGVMASGETSTTLPLINPYRLKLKASTLICACYPACRNPISRLFTMAPSGDGSRLER